MQTKLSWSEAVYQRQNPHGDPFRYDGRGNKQLEIIGLILWITEGDKTQLSLANGSPAIIRKYLEFLRKVCRLKEGKIRGVIHCHDTLPYQTCVAYWSRISKIPRKRFKKPYIKKDHGGKRKYPYGIMRVVATNTKLVRIFKERLEELGLPRN